MCNLFLLLPKYKETKIKTSTILRAHHIVRTSPTPSLSPSFLPPLQKHIRTHPLASRPSCTHVTEHQVARRSNALPLSPRSQSLPRVSRRGLCTSGTARGTRQPWRLHEAPGTIENSAYRGSPTRGWGGLVISQAADTLALGVRRRGCGRCGVRG